MMKRHWVAILLSLTALLLVCNGVQASSTNSGDPALISIDIENGEYSMDSIIFSGIIDFYFACNDFYAYDLAICINALCFDKKKRHNRKGNY